VQNRYDLPIRSITYHCQAYYSASYIAGAITRGSCRITKWTSLRKLAVRQTFNFPDMMMLIANAFPSQCRCANWKKRLRTHYHTRADCRVLGSRQGPSTPAWSDFGPANKKMAPKWDGEETDRTQPHPLQVLQPLVRTRPNEPLSQWRDRLLKHVAGFSCLELLQTQTYDVTT
jgi:hypothetical protein